MVGGVGVGAFVGDLAIGLERHETVREADGNEELVAVFGGEFRADPLTVGRGATADVDRDVEDPAADAADQLVLPARRRLEVQPAQGEGGRGIGVVVLHEGAVDAECGKGGDRMHLGEPATGVAMAFGADELDGGGHNGVAIVHCCLLPLLKYRTPTWPQARRTACNVAIWRACAYRREMLDHASAPGKRWIGHVPFVVLLCSFCGLAFLGGSSRPDTFALVALRPILLAALFCLAILPQTFDARTLRPLLILLGLFATWIVFQLVPLPSGLWSALPGHQRFVMADSLIEATPWRPISLVPDVTFGALVDLLVPLVLLIALGMSGPRGRRVAPEIIIAVAMLGVFFAVVQSLTGSGPMYRVSYPTISGIFANRNHQALMLAIGIPFAALWVRDGGLLRVPTNVRMMVGGLCILLFLGTILITGSRAGLVLGMLGLVAVPGILPTTWLRDRRIWSISVALVAMLFAGIIYFGRAQSVDRLMTMQGTGGEGRIEFLPITWTILRDFFPFGAGISVFDPIYRVYEPDWALHTGYFNRAHNDWLDLVLGGGAVAAILALALCIVLARAVANGFKQREQRYSTIAAATALLQIAIASGVDYPLRTPLLSGVFTLICVLLFVPSGPRQRTP